MQITINQDLSAHIVSEDGKSEIRLPSWNPLTMNKFTSEADVRHYIATSLKQEYFIPIQAAPVVDLKTEVTVKTQQRLDDFAKTKNYDSILSAATYATSKIPKFAAEGQRAVDLRDETWAKLYEILESVTTGQRVAPKTFEEIEIELPVLSW